MERIKKIANKLNTGEFSTFIPIGADAVNVDMQSGKNLEEEMSSIGERIEDVEFNLPILAKNIDGNPEGIEVEKLTPNTLWFIKDDKNENLINGVSILGKDGHFSQPILLNVDLKNIQIDENDEDIKSILDKMGVTVDNYYEVIKVILQSLSENEFFSFEIKPDTSGSDDYILFIK